MSDAQKLQFYWAIIILISKVFFFASQISHSRQNLLFFEVQLNLKDTILAI